MTVGFTSGIAVIIFASQIKDLLGLTLAGAEPGPLLPKLDALGRPCRTFNAAAAAVAVLAVGDHPRLCAGSARIGRAC